jgi:hypothetical protein
MNERFEFDFGPMHVIATLKTLEAEQTTAVCLECQSLDGGKLPDGLATPELMQQLMAAVHELLTGEPAELNYFDLAQVRESGTEYQRERVADIVGKFKEAA